MAERKSWDMIAALMMFSFLTVTLPAFVIYALGGAENQTNLISFFFFGILGVTTVLIYIVLAVLDYSGWFNRNPEYQVFKDVLTLHSPENTTLGKFVPALQSPATMTLVFIVVAMVIGISVSVSGQFVSGVPNLVDGSVSDTTKLALAVEPADSAETLFFQGFLLQFQTAMFAFILLARGVSKFQSIFIAKVISVITTTIAAFLYHSFRYGASETAQGGVLILFGTLNTLTALTNSVIPAYLIHGSSNLFAKASAEGIFSSEFAVVAAISIAMLSVAALFVKFFAKDGNR